MIRLYELILDNGRVKYVVVIGYCTDNELHEQFRKNIRYSEKVREFSLMRLFDAGELVSLGIDRYEANWLAKR